MFRRAALILAGACGLLAAVTFAVAAGPAARQPVFIVLYSRFYDHSHPRAIDERLQRLLPLLENLRAKYPQSGISALLQFSGTTSQIVAERNSQLRLLDQVKEYERRGLVEVGYTGEDEPSYLYRPKANLLLAETPEDRWKAKAEAAEHFLSDFKDPVTGVHIPGLTGGLQRMQEIFGKAAFISGANPTRLATGGDSAVTHEVRRLNQTAMMQGIPASDPRRGIEGQFFSALSFSKIMSPDKEESPEVFWQDGMLRLSDTSLLDYKPHSTEESLETLKKAFENLDRSHIRIIKLEVASYLRYLVKRVDGSVAVDPMEWLYFHPDDPAYPMTMKVMVTQTEIEVGYRKEEKTLEWLTEQFFPANPGSRFISIREIARMGEEAETHVSLEQIKALAADIDGQYAKLPMVAPNFARGGNRFFSLAESFQVLTQALAAAQKTGALPQAVRLARVYGPLEIPDNNMGLAVASFTVSEVIHAAAQVAAPMVNDSWKTVPANTVPAWLDLAGKRVNAAQFLRLMAQACLDPVPDKMLKINAIQMFSGAAFMFPKNTAMSEQSLSWTWKPAFLNLGGAGNSAAGQ